MSQHVHIHSLRLLHTQDYIYWIIEIKRPKISDLHLSAYYVQIQILLLL